MLPSASTSIPAGTWPNVEPGAPSCPVMWILALVAVGVGDADEAAVYGMLLPTAVEAPELKAAEWSDAAMVLVANSKGKVLVLIDDVRWLFAN